MSLLCPRHRWLGVQSCKLVPCRAETHAWGPRLGLLPCQCSAALESAPVTVSPASYRGRQTPETTVQRLRSRREPPSAWGRADRTSVCCPTSPSQTPRRGAIPRGPCWPERGAEVAEGQVWSRPGWPSGGAAGLGRGRGGGWALPPAPAPSSWVHGGGEVHPAAPGTAPGQLVGWSGVRLGARPASRSWS